MAAMSEVTKTSLKEVIRRYHGASHVLNDGLLQAAPYRQVIMQHFITAFFNPQSHEVRPNAWVYELPNLLSDHSSSALVYSVRAASMAHYGKRTGDKSMQIEACRWYDKGLKAQRLQNERTELHISMPGNIDQRLGVAAVSAPLMFSLFESMMTTSYVAWSQHLKAAAKMLEIRGAINCQSGLIHHVFRTVRIGAVSLNWLFEIDRGLVHGLGADLTADIHGNDLRSPLNLCFGRMVHYSLFTKWERISRQTRRYITSISRNLCRSQQYARTSSSEPRLGPSRVQCGSPGTRSNCPPSDLLARMQKCNISRL